MRVADAPPVLVIGNTRDPATPYVGAKDLHDRIDGSRLLTVDNTGHGSYATGNRCVDRIVNRYLVSGKAPARDPLRERAAAPSAMPRLSTHTSTRPMSRIRFVEIRRTANLGSRPRTSPTSAGASTVPGRAISVSRDGEVDHRAEVVTLPEHECACRDAGSGQRQQIVTRGALA